MNPSQPAIPPPPRAVIDAPSRRVVPLAFLTFDPGLAESSGTGWAHYRDGTLCAAGVLVPKGDTLEAKLLNLRLQSGELHDRYDVPVYVEHMRVYPAVRQVGDPNDLVELAVAEGVLIGMAPKVTLVAARTWKGTVPKEKFAKRILEALRPAERALLEAIPGRRAHNAVDAAGLGLHVAGRL